jgi:hypothetical protein
VIGDDLDSIASGPTVPDHSTFEDCLIILEKYRIFKRIPSAVAEIFKKGVHGEIEETPKPGDPVFARTQNLIIGSNIMAVEAAAEKSGGVGIQNSHSFHIHQRSDPHQCHGFENRAGDLREKVVCSLVGFELQLDQKKRLHFL